MRTAAGDIKNKPLKAIDWYMEEHNLTLRASNAWPYITFGVSDGTEQQVHISEILSDYVDHQNNQKRSRVES